MQHVARLHSFLIILALAACGSSSKSTPDAAATPNAACVALGTDYCQKMYTCYSATDIAGFGLPATQAECVTMENAQCGAAPPKPGYCKGSAQASDAAATACANEISGDSCDVWKQPAPSTSACKSGLCAM